MAAEDAKKKGRMSDMGVKSEKFEFHRSFEELMEGGGLKNVVILGHRNPDGDAAGCVMGLAHYLKTVYPKYRVIPYLSEKLDKGPKKQVMEDAVFDPFALPELEERYLAIVCDTATEERIVGRELYDNAARSIVIDHHASNQGYGTACRIEISEACSENVWNMLDWERWKEASKDRDGQFPKAPDYLYMGILHDTGGFKRAKENTMRAALELWRLGADHKRIMRTMNSMTLDDLKKQAALFDRAERVLDKKVAYVVLDQEESRRLGVGYEDIHPVSSILRDCEDIEMAFTMYEEEPDMWRCSFRSDGKWIDVNELILPFGGGGHAGAAGLRKRTQDPEGLKNAILEEIEKTVRN